MRAIYEDEYRLRNIGSEPIHVIGWDWIRVADRLPEDAQRVVVSYNAYVGDKTVRVAHEAIYANEGFVQTVLGRVVDITDRVTHWMPYPAPAKN